MCGRFSRADDLNSLTLRFNLEQAGTASLEPRYNIAPGQAAAVIVKEGGRRLGLFRWGLVPPWSKDPKSGFKPINARAETLAQKPMYKGPFAQKRCLIPADGFYEWQKQGKSKIPWRFLLADGATFAFAGIWELWQGPDEARIHSFSIITTQANQLVAGVHDRMPVILRPEDEEPWLSAGPKDTGFLQGLLRPYPAEAMRNYRVSDRVNSPASEGAQLIEPVAEQPGLPGLNP